MKIEVRFFVLDDEGGVMPLDKDRFDKAVGQQEPLTEYAGRCIKVGGALVDADRDPPEILEYFGQYVYFDSAGLVDEEKLNQSAMFGDKVAEEVYRNEFIWVPNPQERAKIAAALD